MEAFSAMYDILLGMDTDLHFEYDDLMLTNGVDYIQREIFKLMITEPGDWKAFPNIGCSPNKYTGEKNTRETGLLIQNYLVEGLKDTVFPAQVSVKVVPTSYDTLMIFVDVFVSDSEITSTSFQFDFINGTIKFNQYDPKVTEQISTQNYKINDISNLKRPNKYWAKITEDFQS